MNILLVDDSEDFRDITDALLNDAGYPDIANAGSAKEAFDILHLDDAAAAPAPADLILLDILMPGIDGIEACARIRNDSRYVDVPIIMLTNLDDIDSLAKAFVAGANDYVTKTNDRVELLARIRSALRLKGELDRRKARERELFDFIANWGDRHAPTWIDDATGLLRGEIGEAYLTATSEHGTEQASIIALAVDRLDAYRASRGEAATRDMLSRIAHAVQRTQASIGAVAASYRNGLIILVVPELNASAARQLAEALRSSVSRLRHANPEAIAADHITASVAVTTGRVRSGPDRVKLLTRAIQTAQREGAKGSNSVVAIDM